MGMRLWSFVQLLFIIAAIIDGISWILRKVGEKITRVFIVLGFRAYATVLWQKPLTWEMHCGPAL